MTCNQATEFLADYLSGELNDQVAVEFEVHVSGCRDCRNYLDSYRKTIALSKSIIVDPQEIPEQVVAAILAAQQGR